MSNENIITVEHLSKHFNLEAGFFSKNKKRTKILLRFTMLFPFTLL